MKMEQINPEQEHSILKKRAQALAVEKKDNIVQQESVEVIKFLLASETYGIETSFVREACPLKSYTELPGVPSFILGIINVRGQIISVVDLKRFFNLPEKGLGELNKVIIIRDGQMEFGILADSIYGTFLLPVDSIRTSFPRINGIGSDYLKGITDEHLIILDAKKILEDEKMIINS